VMVERLDHARIHWGYKCDDLEPLFEYITPAQWIIDLIPRGDSRDVGAAVLTAKGELDGIDMSGENNPVWKGGITYDMKAYKKEHNKAYKKTPERKAYEKAYRQTPEYKAYTKAYNKEYNKKRNATPERKAYEKAYQKAHNQTPERKAYMKAYMKEYRLRKNAETQGEGTLDPFLK